MLFENIRIFNGCEEQIENSVPKVTGITGLGELSQVTEFQFTPNNHYGFFFPFSQTCIKQPPLGVVKLSVIHRWLSLHLSWNNALFYHFYNYIDVSTFSVKKCLVWFLPMTLTLKYLMESDVKNGHHSIKKTSLHHAGESSYNAHPFTTTQFQSHMQRHFLSVTVSHFFLVWFGES